MDFPKDIPLFKGAFPIREMEEYGYSFEDSNQMIPLKEEKAVELFEKGYYVFVLYCDGTEAEADDVDHIRDSYSFGMCGVTLELQQIKDLQESN